MTNELTKAKIESLNGNKGLGPDGISAHVLKLGGKWLASQLCTLLSTFSAAVGRVPAAWRGGRMANIYKKKGDPDNCNSYRGILVSSHVSKILTDFVADT